MRQPERVPRTPGGKMETMDRRTAASRSTTPWTASSNIQVDWAKVAWNNRWLLFLGLIAGLGGGYFQFVKATPRFRSSARVQIVEPNVGNLPIAGVEMASAGQKRSITDEAIVMRSERILRRAAELGELSGLDEFRGLPLETIAAIISGPQLTIAPPSSSNSNSILEISYASTSPDTCQAVVQSVVDAYEMHLQDQHQNVGQQTLDLIEKARKEVLEKLTSLETDFAEYKEKSGLVFRGGVTTDIHRDNADKILGQKQLLLIEKSKLLSKIEAARLAVKEDRPVEAVLLALQMTPDAPVQTSQLNAEDSEEVTRLKMFNQATVSERMRREQLLPLQLERQELTASVGNDHPAMRTMDTRLRAMEATIEEIAKSENEFRQQLEAAWAKQAELSAQSDQPVEPTVILQERVKIGVMALRQQLESLSEEEKLLDEAYKLEVEQAKSESDADSTSAKFVREIDRQQQLYNRIVERLDEVNLMADQGGLRLFTLNVAKPGFQFEPSLQKSLAIGGFIGLILAGGLAFLREISDRSYHSAGEITGHVGLPVIGHVPVLPAKHPDGENIDLALAKLDPRICTAMNRKGSRSEAFRSIRTAIYFNNQSATNQVLQITSSTPGEGKSTIAANLAVSIAQSGRSVILIDADLRRPRVHNLFGAESAKGVAWAIEQVAKLGNKSNLALTEAILETGVPNLSLMVAGDRPDNPAELLSSSAFQELVDMLRQKFDMVLIDSPPLLAVSDPSNVVRRADGVLMVVRLRKNAKPLVARACRMLESLEANVLGVVVNGVGSRQARGYGKDSESGMYYGYGYSYGSELNSYSEYYDESKPRSGKTSKSKRSKLKANLNGTPVAAGVGEEFDGK